MKSWKTTSTFHLKLKLVGNTIMMPWTTKLRNKSLFWIKTTQTIYISFLIIVFLWWATPSTKSRNHVCFLLTKYFRIILKIMYLKKYMQSFITMRLIRQFTTIKSHFWSGLRSKRLKETLILWNALIISRTIWNKHQTILRY